MMVNGINYLDLKALKAEHYAWIQDNFEERTWEDKKCQNLEEHITNLSEFAEIQNSKGFDMDQPIPSFQC